ncbi:MAG: 4-(cytidine 5'-diphospho)-2-C-methyl-D-erythritol kinase [Bryobacterales bacterium]|nr:4-(cytidine 5'-diphospho)-2-C-methyl-D-erythritol kinase [Bryobacterales bacterium]
MPTATVPSFAKINLALKVLHHRPDGYHEIRTIFQTISLADRLTITAEPARRTKLTIDATIDIPDNIILKAADRLLDKLKRRAQVHFLLQKRIPMGGGLGGGSSNAAAVLLGLPPLLGISPPATVLHEIAASLGSDVPFFLMGGTALGLGRGEELYPFPETPVAHGVLVLPGVHVSTPEAYKALQRTTETPFPNSFPLSTWDAPHDWRTFSENDFEGPVFRLYPKVVDAHTALTNAGANPTRLSGSGSSVFGFFESKSAASAAAKRIPGAVLFSTLNRKRYRLAWGRA